MGSCSYLFYYHSWLTAVPNLLHLAIPTLPANVMKESNTTTTSKTSFSDDGNVGKKNKHIKKQSNSEVASALLKMAEQQNEILKDKTRLEVERHSLLRECTLIELMKGHNENLTNARCRLSEMKLDPKYDSDASECQEAKKYIELFKMMYTKSFEALNSSSSDLQVLLLVLKTYINCFKRTE